MQLAVKGLEMRADLCRRGTWHLVHRDQLANRLLPECPIGPPLLLVDPDPLDGQAFSPDDIEQPICLLDGILGDIVPVVDLQNHLAVVGHFLALLAGDVREHLFAAGIETWVQPHHHRTTAGVFEFPGIDMVAPRTNIRDEHRV